MRFKTAHGVVDISPHSKTHAYLGSLSMGAEIAIQGSCKRLIPVPMTRLSSHNGYHKMYTQFSQEMSLQMPLFCLITKAKVHTGLDRGWTPAAVKQMMFVKFPGLARRGGKEGISPDL